MIGQLTKTIREIQKRDKRSHSFWIFHLRRFAAYTEKIKKIITLEKTSRIPPIPILETDDLSKSNHETEATRLQNVEDIKTLIVISKEWSENDDIL